MRLDKFISDAAAFSRREIKQLVSRGAVSVNGTTVSRADVPVNESDEVCVNGQLLRYRKYVYLMLNKPQGYVSATEDKHDPVVVDLVPEEFKHFRVFPVGRLDKDTEGLLLLTNDGRFDHAVMSPRREIAKSYLARLAFPAVPEDAELFRSGMDLGDFIAKPAVLEITADPCVVRVVIREGKYHQVKRMCERIGKPVVSLRREAVGGLRLDESLPPGAVRELTDEDFAALGVEMPEQAES